MYLVAGLGNPGPNYEATRHNIGFMVVDAIGRDLACSFSPSKWSGETFKTFYCGEQVVFVKPTTFMNLSGQCVAAVASYYKIPCEKIIVAHDDLDLPLGRLKICQNRGHGGHNGIKSLISHLGSKDFIRLKMGIGRNPVTVPVEKYVLSKFAKAEHDLVEGEIDLAIEGIRFILEKDVAEAMQTIHSRSV